MIDAPEADSRRVLVQTRGLTKVYGPVAALDGVDAEVREGMVFGLVGPNGSGKTTLLSVLAGLRRPTSGEVVLGVPRAKTALLPDTPEFEPWLTARELVDLARHLVDPRIPVARVDEVLADAGIAAVADRKCGGFSRGMLQRLGVAATLVGDPDLLLMDEPASALDPAGRSEVLNLIAQQRGRRTVIFSSHILSDVQQVSDAVGVMQRGRLIYQGALGTLLTGEATPTYSIRLRGDETAAMEEFQRQPWVTHVERVASGELRLSVTSLDDAERGISAALTRAGARVVSLQPEEVSLERAFLKLTGGAMQL